ncbi:hypothetical protein [Noviherbaspirillum galbum]|uniref:Uncharacterized protein n=1 Tax=Noviherbaspirillum galbum TaxID=2709383 RepID=A0A6B3SUQ7_9BURK|nr:hypothetical protein [Noviherbaspirillum galbum]NEX61369.1 hypothetical protein [Noviherbaspirillum galbum]
MKKSLADIGDRKGAEDERSFASIVAPGPFRRAVRDPDGATLPLKSSLPDAAAPRIGGGLDPQMLSD